MLVLSNEEIAKLLSIEECMAALEPMYRDVADEKVLFSPRVDNIVPNPHPEAYYAFKHMGGTCASARPAASASSISRAPTPSALQSSAAAGRRARSSPPRSRCVPSARCASTARAARRATPLSPTH